MTSPVAHTGIVVGTDGSAPSTEAVRWAAREAGMRKVPLDIVHVRTSLPVSVAAMGWAVAPIPQEVFDWQLNHAQSVIDDAVATAAAADATAQIGGEVICGSAVQTLINLSKEAQMTKPLGAGRISSLCMPGVTMTCRVFPEPSNRRS